MSETENYQPHELRVIEEKAELDAREAKLFAFMTGDKFKTLPDEDRKLLMAQLVFMRSYSDILARRIERF